MKQQGWLAGTTSGEAPTVTRKATPNRIADFRLDLTRGFRSPEFEKRFMAVEAWADRWAVHQLAWWPIRHGLLGRLKSMDEQQVQMLVEMNAPWYLEGKVHSLVDQLRGRKLNGSLTIDVVDDGLLLEIKMSRDLHRAILAREMLARARMKQRAAR